MSIFFCSRDFHPISDSHARVDGPRGSANRRDSHWSCHKNVTTSRNDFIRPPPFQLKVASPLRDAHVTPRGDPRTKPRFDISVYVVLIPRSYRGNSLHYQSRSPIFSFVRSRTIYSIVFIHESRIENLLLHRVLLILMYRLIFRYYARTVNLQ